MNFLFFGFWDFEKLNKFIYFSELSEDQITSFDFLSFRKYKKFHLVFWASRTLQQLLHLIFCAFRSSNSCLWFWAFDSSKKICFYFWAFKISNNCIWFLWFWKFKRCLIWFLSFRKFEKLYLMFELPKGQTILFDFSDFKKTSNSIWFSEL